MTGWKRIGPAASTTTRAQESDMDANYTHIIMVLDRSGSMNSGKNDTIGGVNTFVEQQAAQPGRCTFTLAQFDHEHEVLYSFAPIADVVPRSATNYQPRGNTALLDAIGRTVVAEGEKLAALPESDRPGLVVVVVVTDGEENASEDWTLDRARALLEGQQRDYNWQVTFLGASLDVAAQSSQLGIAAQNAAVYHQTSAGLAGSSSATSRARSALRGGASGQSLRSSFNYTDAERKQMGES